MGVRGILAAMVGGTALAIVVATTQCEPRHALDPAANGVSRSTPATQPGPFISQDPVPADARVQAAWLSVEATQQLLAPGGRLGPLFEGVVLGGPAPSTTVVDRIAAFARANDVTVDLHIVAGNVAAVRLDVLFRGVGGYEGADALGLRLGRRHENTCEGCEQSWSDDWAFSDGNQYVHSRVRVNRVLVGWERAWTLVELLAFAEGLIGQEEQTSEAAVPDRWKKSSSYCRDVPYVINGWGASPRSRFEERGDIGIQCVARAGWITEVSFRIHREDSEDGADIEAKLRKRWGRPRVADGTRYWKLRGRIIEAYGDPSEAEITIRAR